MTIVVPNNLKVNTLSSNNSSIDDEELGWDEYFISIAHAVSRKSKDPSCKVGAILVSEDQLIIATGFNGFPRTLLDDPTILANKLEKLDWVVHAEHNAVLNAGRSGTRTNGCTLYVNKFPCFGCLKVIAQAGISRIYTDDAEFWKHDPDDSDHSGKRYILLQAKIRVSAPNHPEFMQKPPLLKPGVRKAPPVPANDGNVHVPGKPASSAAPRLRK